MRETLLKETSASSFIAPKMGGHEKRAEQPVFLLV